MSFFTRLHGTLSALHFLNCLLHMLSSLDPCELIAFFKEQLA